MRLTKRMGQLDLCSRREAERLIINNKVLVKGVPAVLGMKVSAQETDIVVEGAAIHKCPAVVLHKPVGYVSGQPEHQHIPAVRLLTNENCMESDMEDLFERGQTTLSGFAPAGRLDRDSSGVLVYCRSGVVAKKLVSSMGLIEKEYVVTLEPAHQVTTKERAQGLSELPPPTLDLSILKKGGGQLLGDSRPLRRIKCRWQEPGRVLQLVLREGRKRQIRRMCRELLGFHVVALERTKIGPINLNKLPSGMWRPLTKKEVDALLSVPNELSR